MISNSWLQKRKPHWERLETLLDKCRGQGLKSLMRDELRELGLLYRQAAADLAVLRADTSSVHFARYLNELLTRAHNIIYSGRRTNYIAVFRFFFDTYPKLFRRNLNYCMIAVILFLGGGVVGSLLTLQDPDFQLKIIGPQMVETIQRHEMWTHPVVAIKPVASSSIMTNNISVAILTFASGITAGLGTIYLVVFNGLLMGVIATACALNGMSAHLWSFVVPHGVLELPAILISTAAGLRLAGGLLFPGVTPRKQSVVLAGQEAVQLVLGCIPMLFVAGIIEGFFSPTDLPMRLKFLVGASLFTLLCLYLAGVLTDLSGSLARRVKSGFSA